MTCIGFLVIFFDLISFWEESIENDSHPIGVVSPIKKMESTFFFIVGIFF